MMVGFSSISQYFFFFCISSYISDYHTLLQSMLLQILRSRNFLSNSQLTAKMTQLHFVVTDAAKLKLFKLKAYLSLYITKPKNYSVTKVIN